MTQAINWRKIEELARKDPEQFLKVAGRAFKIWNAHRGTECFEPWGWSTWLVKDMLPRDDFMFMLEWNLIARDTVSFPIKGTKNGKRQSSTKLWHYSWPMAQMGWQWLEEEKKGTKMPEFPIYDEDELHLDRDPEDVNEGK